MSGFPWLTVLMLIPLLGGVALFGMDPAGRNRIRGVALGVSALVMVLVAVVWFEFDAKTPGFQFEERYSWIPSLRVEYRAGVDGLGLSLIGLTSLVVFMALLSSGRVTDRPQLYFGLVLLLEAGLVGTFSALNFVHWFLFWEVSLVPAFFLVHLWGGQGRRDASLQFFIYTMVGSVALLLAFLGLYLATGTFDFTRLAELAGTGELKSAVSARLGWGHLSEETLHGILFGMVLLGFAVKLPLVPFHTWLPTTYSTAPTPVTMMLTGLMSKMGAYGLIRILLPIFPEPLRQYQGVLLFLAVLSILVPAFCALAENDIKRILAYSSINHLGYCFLGVVVAAAASVDPAAGRLASSALAGTALQMVNHGVTAAALFCCVGMIEARSAGATGLDHFGGLRARWPALAGFMGIAVFASMGLPGLNGFVSEYMIFQGALPVAPWSAGFSLLGVMLTAIFLLRLFQGLFYGPVDARWNGVADLTRAERMTLLPATVMMLVLGVYPRLVLDLVSPLVSAWLNGPNG